MKAVASCGDAAKVMVIQLLPFRRCCAKNSSPSHLQIRARRMQRLVNEEIFLFPAESRNNLGHILVEILAHGGRRFVNTRQRFEQWSLIVQCKSGVANENGRNAQCFSPHKRR